VPKKTTSGRNSPPQRRPRPLAQIPDRDAVFRPKPQQKPKRRDYPTLKPRTRKVP
jgi:hypothetical protein